MRDNRRPENWGAKKKRIAQIVKELTGEYPVLIERTYAGRHQKASGCCLWAADLPGKQILGADSMTNLLKEYKTFEITESGVVRGDFWFWGKDEK